MRFFRQTVRTILVTILAGLFTGCGFESLSPVPSLFDGTYALYAVNGSALPATVAQGDGEHYILLADTLRFSSAGTVTRVVVYRHLSASLPRDSVYRMDIVFDYEVEGTNLAVGFFRPCPLNASCIGTEEGVITESRMTIVGRLFWGGDPVLSFRRIRDR